jgi:glycosyltransferase involved in cell wall biosynthesis
MASNYKKHSEFFPVTEACLARTRNAYIQSKNRSNVIFTPIYPPQLISYFYGKADIYVMPTRYDTPGMSILEAMAAGLPVITTSITSIPEFVAHEKNGFLIDVKDYDLRSDEYFEYAVEEMQKYLTILIRDASLRRSMGLDSIRRMETMFSLDYKIDRLVSTIKSIVA